MLQLNNATPFSADVTVFADANGVDTLYTVVKGSFTYDGTLTLASEQAPISKGDEYLGDTKNSSLITASDYHIGKIASDIIVQGSAITPDHEPYEQLDVTVQVGIVSKSVRVFGDRDWQAGTITVPVPFTNMPITYERAYGANGAVWMQNDHPPANKNPAGVGYIPKGREANGISLPNIEEINNLITAPEDNPAPAGLSYIAPHWAPRRYLAGTYDKNWQKSRAPYLPKDFDPKFFNNASSGLTYDGFLQGGEQIWVEGMHQRGSWQAAVPSVELQVKVKFGTQTDTARFNLETLVLEPNTKNITVVWRSALPVSKKALSVESINVTMVRKG